MDDRQNAEVRDSLVAQFLQGQSGVAALFIDDCTCAPGYWKLVAGLGIKAPKVSTFSIPNERTGKVYKLDGAQIQDSGDLSRIAHNLATQVGIKPIIRRLTTKEIAKFWVVIPFDIEEPLFVVEAGSRQIVLCLRRTEGGQNWRVWWVDALTEYDYGEGPTHEDTPKAPNQAPTTTAVMPHAALRVAPAVVVAHL
jgi:hypothetical protein